MKKNIKKILIVSQKIRKEWVLCFLMGIGLIVACQGALEEGNPFGPSNSNIVIAQSSPQINKGGTQNFTAIGGTLPISWSLSAATAGQNTTIGAIDAGTGVFTAAAEAPQVAGVATVTVVDAVGDTDTATITVLPNILAIAPGSSTQQAGGTEEFTVAGGSGEFVATFQARDSDYITKGLTGVAAVGAVVTATFVAIPNGEVTPRAGDDDFQRWTITITDKENGDAGSVILTLIPLAAP